MRPPPVIAPVPQLWPGSTVVCIGTGPSLTAADVTLCQDRAHVIAINDAFRLAPWAGVLYAADARWWKRFSGVPSFTGRKYSIMPNGHLTVVQAYPDIHILKNTGQQGLERDPSGLRTGWNSGFQAINLAVHLGARRILLLGYDMHGDHYFGSHPDKSTPLFGKCLAAFPSLVEPLAAIGVTVLNCTPGSSLTTFPMARLAAVLEEVAA